MIGAAKARVGAVQRQLPLRRGRAPLSPARRRRPAPSSTTRASRRMLARILPKLPPLALLLQVDDGSGDAAPARARATTRQALRGELRRSRRHPDARRRPLHRSTPAARPACRRACSGARPTSSSPRSAVASRASKPSTSLDDVVARAGYGDMNRTLPAPPFMHGAGHWTAFITLHSGGTVHRAARDRAASIPTTSGARSSASVPSR